MSEDDSNWIETTCPKCGMKLKAEPDADYYECPKCGQKFTVEVLPESEIKRLKILETIESDIYAEETIKERQELMESLKQSEIFPLVKEIWDKIWWAIATKKPLVIKVYEKDGKWLVEEIKD